MEEKDHTRMDTMGDSTDSRTASTNKPAPTGGGFATWTFNREVDGRHIAEAHVACYGVDDIEAMAECVKHLLVDVLAVRAHQRA